MIRLLSAAAAILLTHAALAAESRVIAFERGTSIWTVNLDGTNASKLASGAGPDLSSDGTRVAFHVDASAGKTLERFVAIADAASRKVTLFKKGIPSANCQRAAWSPDGSQLLFSLFVGSDWHLGLIDADGGNFRYAKKSGPNGSSYYSTCWAPDGHSFYAQDLNKIYQFALDGAELKSWTVLKLFPTGGLSSATRMAVSPDGKRLLLDVEMDEEVKIKDWEGPAPILYVLDLGSAQTTRLTPKGSLAWCGGWISDEEILFDSQAVGEKTPSIYRMSAAGKGRQLVLKNGQGASVSR